MLKQFTYHDKNDRAVKVYWSRVCKIDGEEILGILLVQGNFEMLV